MPDALSAINLRDTPQSQPADPRQVRNSAGGYTFTVAPVERLRRFLVLGVDGGTYYASERELTKANAEVVLAWARDRAGELVDEVVSISTSGRAPRNNAALFALAAAAALGDAEGRKAALAALPKVARTGTHLFVFAGYVEQFRGWGRGLRRAVAGWYLSKPVDAVAYQAVKYRQREGWSHRDLLRLAHPATDEDGRKQLFDWICGRSEEGPALVEGFRQAQSATTAREWVAILDRYPSLSWEMLPDAALGEAEVWSKLIGNGVPQTALMRQLPRLTRLGLLAPMSGTLEVVVGQLTDRDRLAKARVHPVNVLVAARTYASRRVGAGPVVVGTGEPRGRRAGCGVLHRVRFGAAREHAHLARAGCLGLDNGCGLGPAGHCPRGVGGAGAGDGGNRAEDLDGRLHSLQRWRSLRPVPARRRCGRDRAIADLAAAAPG